MSVNDVDVALRETGLYKLLSQQAKSAATGVDEMKKQADIRIDALHKHMEELVEKIKLAEEQLDLRLFQLENALKNQVKEIEEEHSAKSGAWFLPFLGLCGIVVAMSFLGCFQVRKIKKMHVY